MNDIPELIEAIPVEISQIDKAATPVSAGVSGRREYFGNIQRDVKFTVPAQVVFGNTDQKVGFTQLGATEETAGYLVLRKIDLENLGKVLQRGDKIVKLGNDEVELFLLHSKGDSAAHFTSIGGFTLFRMFFADRKPDGG